MAKFTERPEGAGGFSGENAKVVARSLLSDHGFSQLDDPPSPVSNDQDVSKELALAGLEDFDLGDKSRLRGVEVHIKHQTPLLPFAGDNSQAAEQYRIIRTKIVQHPRRPRVIVVSSAESGDGKSVTAVNIGGVISLNPEFNVLLCDVDLHRGSLAKYFDLPIKPGLADVLTGGASLRDCVVRIEPFPNLFFLPGGKSSRGPADLLNSRRWDTLVSALRKQFNYCILDTPPAGALADFQLAQASADGVVLVARQDHTNRMLWVRALETVPKEKMIGVIMNCVKPWFLARSGSYYQYYHYSKYYRR